MTEFLPPVVYTALLWWFSTGAILYLDGLPRRTFARSMTGATGVLLTALYALAASSGETGTSAAYVAFTAAVLVWGWQEMSFLMGYVAGPRRTPSPPQCPEWRRFLHAVGAIAWHELAIALGALLILAVTWQAPNQLGLWTYLLLWGMRLSAKLNLFLGVRNWSEEFLPEHLRYLTSFFRHRSMNLLFPVSVSVGTAAAVILAQAAMLESGSAAERAGMAMLATLMVLAVLEHWFMVLPLPVNAIWNWGMRSREAAEAPGAPPAAALQAQPAAVPVSERTRAARRPVD